MLPEELADDFVEPFHHYSKECYRPHIQEHFDEDEIEDDITKFPRNINTVIWYQVGQHDGDNWILVGRLESGKYFYFNAWCDYTGFDCQSGIDLYLSNTKIDLYTYCVSEYDRNLMGVTVPKN